MLFSSASFPLSVSSFETSQQISSDGRTGGSGGRRPDKRSHSMSRVLWGKRVLALAILCLGALSRLAPSAAAQSAHFSGAMSTLGSDFSSPTGVAVDGSGNVFVADIGNSAVKEILAAGGYTTVHTLGSGFSGPGSVAVDGSGNVFVADTDNNAVKEILAAGGYTTVNTLGSGFHQPEGVAVDSSGNVFVADTFNNAVVKMDFSDPPRLSFALTALGSTSSDSAQTVMLMNIGNAALTFLVPATGLNPSIAAGFTIGNSSTCPQLASSSSAATLAPGSSCTNLISFTPNAVGSISGSLVTTDNHLNAAAPNYATQNIALSGTGTAGTRRSALPFPIIPMVTLRSRSTPLPTPLVRLPIPWSRDR
jgi:hypothetical protein